MFTEHMTTWKHTTRQKHKLCAWKHVANVNTNQVFVNTTTGDWTLTEVCSDMPNSQFWREKKSSISRWHYSERSHLMVSGAVVRCVNCKKFRVARCKDFWEKGQIFKILFINKFCGRRRGISIRQKEEKFYRGFTQNCYLNSSGFTYFH